MGDLIHIRDFKTREEREAEIGRLGMAIVSEALGPTDQELFQIEAGDQIEAYTAPDGDCA